ncbi:MAG: hypothetical protein V8S27_06955 [Lachnospiraceae bacterium]
MIKKKLQIFRGVDVHEFIGAEGRNQMNGFRMISDHEIPPFSLGKGEELLKKRI